MTDLAVKNYEYARIHLFMLLPVGGRVGILSVEYSSPSTTCRNSRVGRTRCRRKNWLVHELTKLRSYDNTTNEL